MGRIAAFDIETTDLKANYGYLLCAVLKIVGTKEEYQWRIDNSKKYDRDKPRTMFDDKQRVKEIVEVLEDCDAVLTHYGSRFDVPFVNTRALYHKIQPTPPLAHIDLWRISRQHLALSSNAQAAVNSIVGAQSAKYHVKREVWYAAMMGSRKDMSELLKYCVNDVDGLIDNYKSLLPLIRNHPYTARIRDLNDPHCVCPACESKRTQKRGFRVTKLQRIERRQCQTCGTWYDGVKTRA
jgi:uncharacterized protein YprB with RNaseH-like and TPR domain